MLVKTKVFPKSARERVVVLGEGHCAVYVKGPAERGLANKRAQALLAKHYGCGIDNVILKRGAKDRHKIFEITKD